MKKVIVTGATGMIGISFIQECILNNTDVVAVVRPKSSNLNRIPESEYVTIVECRLDNLSSLETLLDHSYDAFYHFGWEATGKTGRQDAIIQNKNIGYTLDAVKVAKKLGCQMFIGAGSQAEYGRLNMDKISPASPINPEIAYGVAKYSAGKLSALLAKKKGIKHSWVRIFSVYGPYDNENTMIMHAIDKMLKHEPTQFTKSEQTWDYLYSKDAGRALYLIGEFGRNQSVYCLGSGKTKVLSEYIEVIKSQTDTPLATGVGELPYAHNQVMNLCADITSLTRDTGFTPQIGFEEGIRRTMEWCRLI